jgi:hypothetical protein
LLAAVVACVLAAAVAEPAHAVDADYYGMNAQFMWRTPSAEWDSQLQAIAATGVANLRVDAPWGKIEPTAPVNGVRTYRWDRFDPMVLALARHNLRWYPTIAYGTLWAAASSAAGWMSPPRDPADYAAFVEAFAARYGSQGVFWAQHPEVPRLPVTRYEIWNEPNVEHFFFDQSTAPERYADLYVPAAAAVRRADPAGRVLIGGLSSVDVGQFLARMRARQPSLWSYVDAISYHPYGGSTTMTFERIDVLRHALQDFGVGHLPIEITETGWASPPSSEEHRALQLRRLVEELPRADCGVTRFIPYTWITDEEILSDPEDWFGIANRDGSLKPSGQAFREAVLRMRGPEAPTDALHRCSAAPSAPPPSDEPTQTPPPPSEEPTRTPLEVSPEPTPTETETKPVRVRVRPGKVRKRWLSIGIDCSSRCTARIRVSARGQVLLRRNRVRVSDRRTVRVRLPRRRLVKMRRPLRLSIRVQVVGVRGQQTEVHRRVRILPSAARR